MDQKGFVKRFGRKHYLKHIEQPLMANEELQRDLKTAKRAVVAASKEADHCRELVGNIESALAASNNELSGLASQAPAELG